MNTNNSKSLEQSKKEAEYESIRQDIIEKKLKIEQMISRGEKSIILEYGSHSLKFGLSSQTTPYEMRMLIAHRVDSGNDKIHTPLNIDFQMMEGKRGEFIHSSNKVEASLRKLGNISQSQIPQTTGGRGRAPKNELRKERVNLTEFKRPEELRDIFYGEETFYIEGRNDYSIRQPIKYGVLNIQENYSQPEAILDLELLTKQAIFELNLPDGMNLNDYTVILSIPDKFHRGQYKAIIDMLLKNLGFGRFYIHVQSVLAAYGGGANPCCVVNIGHTSITISTVEDGVIVPDSTIVKYFGGCDIDLILKKLIEEKNAIQVIPENSKLDSSKHKMMTYYERLRQNFSGMACQDNTLIEMDTNYPAEENEPSKITCQFNTGFVVSIAALFYPELFQSECKKSLSSQYNKLDINDEYFTNYKDIEDQENEAEANMQQIMYRSKNADFLNFKNKVLDSLGLNSEEFYDPYSMQKLQDLVSFSILQLKDSEARIKAANNIILTGGLAVTPLLLETLEDRLIDRIGRFDPKIERVEVHNFHSRKLDLKTISWLGGTVIPKLDCMEDGFISKERWLGIVDNSQLSKLLDYDEYVSQEEYDTMIDEQNQRGDQVEIDFGENDQSSSSKGKNMTMDGSQGDETQISAGDEEITENQKWNPYGVDNELNFNFGVKFMKEKIGFQW